MSMDPAPTFTPQQYERMAILFEELGEALQALGKVQRHGFYSSNPFDQKAGDNQNQLERELGHVVAAMSMLSEVTGLGLERISKHCEDKKRYVQKWLHFPVVRK